jgi:hypothetical protein
MAERRSLVDGVTEVSQEDFDTFVYGQKPKPKANLSSPSGEPSILPQFQGRVPLTTRVSPEIATSLKRASLSRQMNGQEPCYVQEIMEQALETWLRSNGYVK